MPGYRRAYRTAKRLYPLMLAAYRRWDQLSDQEKEQYRERARRISNQAMGYAREAVENTPRVAKDKLGRRRKRR
jgi:hypothetical protein